MTLPVATLIRPADLAGASNGQLPQSILTTIWDGSQRDQLHHLAARAWLALRAEALEAGIRLRFTDGYRPLADQERLFLSRYVTTPLPGRPTKRWRNQTWWLKPGVATAATPGTSNHGLGLALDLSEELDGDADDESISPRAVAWLVEHAARFGFSAELQSEPWHWRYVAGDHLPAAVLEYEAGFAPPAEDAVRILDVTVPTNDGKGEAVVDLAPGDFLAATGPTAWGAVPQVGWRPNGATQIVVAVEDWFPGQGQVPVRVLAKGAA